MSSSPTLDTVISDLLTAEKKQWLALQRGLRLAFTPADQNDGRYRLCLSRRDGRPSESEDRTVLAHLKLALSGQGRTAVDLTLRPNQLILARYCTVIEWHEYEQIPLLLGAEPHPNTTYQEA